MPVARSRFWSCSYPSHAASLLLRDRPAFFTDTQLASRSDRCFWISRRLARDFFSCAPRLAHRVSFDTQVYIRVRRVLSRTGSGNTALESSSHKARRRRRGEQLRRFIVERDMCDMPSLQFDPNLCVLFVKRRSRPTNDFLVRALCVPGPWVSWT